MVFFIPWRVVAEESGAAHLASTVRCRRICSTGASRLGGRWRGRRHGRRLLFSLVGASDDDDASPVRRELRGQLRDDPIGHSSLGCSGVLSLRHFRLARWCSLSLGGWWPRNPARRIWHRRCAADGSARPARAASAADGEVDVTAVGFFLVWSGRAMMMMPRRFGASYAVSFATTRSATARWGAPACFLSAISGWRDGVLYPLAGGGRGIRRGAFGIDGALPTDLLDRREPPRRQMARSTSRPSASF